MMDELESVRGKVRVRRPSPVIPLNSRSELFNMGEVLTPTVTYAYVPFASDNVYEDMGVAAFLLRGPKAKVAPLHAAILTAITEDEEANEREVLRVLAEVTLGPDEAEKAPDNALAAAIRMVEGVTWEAVEELDEEAVDVVTEIDFIYYHEGGLAFAWAMGDPLDPGMK
jgi:hypothetical protein